MDFVDVAPGNWFSKFTPGPGTYQNCWVKDDILSDLEQSLQRLTQAKVNTYMFDGAVILLLESEMHILQEILGTLGEKWNVAFKLDRFSS